MKLTFTFHLFFAYALKKRMLYSAVKTADADEM